MLSYNQYQKDIFRYNRLQKDTTIIYRIYQINNNKYKMETQNKIRNCLIRFLLFTEEYTNCEKSELNDMEISKDELKEELTNLLKDY